MVKQTIKPREPYLAPAWDRQLFDGQWKRKGGGRLTLLGYAAIVGVALLTLALAKLTLL